MGKEIGRLGCDGAQTAEAMKLFLEESTPKTSVDDVDGELLIEGRVQPVKALDVVVFQANEHASQTNI